jgi:hypothetical protein
MNDRELVILAHVMRVNRIISWSIQLDPMCGFECERCEQFVAGMSRRDWELKVKGKANG